MTPLPALGRPPSARWTAVALMKSELESVSSWRRESDWTATTPLTSSRSLTLFAGNVADTPPYTIRKDCPIRAVGTVALIAPIAANSCCFT